MKYLNKIDLFSQQVSFIINGNKKFKSKISLALTIICYLLIAICSFIFGQNFYLQKNPNLLSYTRIPKNFTKPLTLTNQNFQFIWRIADNNAKNVNFTNKLYPVITYVQIDLLNMTNTNFRKLDPLTPCNELSEPYPYQGVLFDPKLYYCLDFSKYKNLTFGRGKGATINHGFYLTFYTCKNSLYKEGECTPIDELKYMFNQENKCFIDYFISGYNLSPQDKNNPLKIEYINKILPLNFNIRIIDDITSKNLIFYDDKGWASTSITKKKLII